MLFHPPGHRGLGPCPRGGHQGGVALVAGTQGSLPSPRGPGFSVLKPVPGKPGVRLLVVAWLLSPAPKERAWLGVGCRAFSLSLKRGPPIPKLRAPAWVLEFRASGSRLLPGGRAPDLGHRLSVPPGG